MQKRQALYRGKAKTVYATDDPNLCVLEFRDDATAFNAEKHAILAEKGRTNNAFNAYIMHWLASAGIKTHFIRKLDATTCLVRRLQMIPVECVVRNRAAGGLCRRLPFQEGAKFDPPMIEFFYKSDARGDPLLSEEQILLLQLAADNEIKQMRELTLQINGLLLPLFQQSGILLVDFKLEFGRYHGELYLGDEFTPDGCRLWDQETFVIYDKDRFRRDLGDVIAHYKMVAQRLGIEI